MEGQGGAADLVAARVAFGAGLALVGDVAEHVAMLVLGPRRAEVHADAPVEHLHLGLVVAVALDAADACEAAAVDQFAFDREQPLGQARQREVVAADLEHVVRLLERRAQRRVEFLEFVAREFLGPGRFVGHVGRGPLTLRFEDARGHAMPPAARSARCAPELITRVPLAAYST